MVKGINNTTSNIIYSYKNTQNPEAAKQVYNNQFETNTVLPSKVISDFNVKIPQNYVKLGVEKFANGQEVHCYKLANGQRIMIAPMKSPKTCVNTYVNTGAMNEKDTERGISHYTEHMAFNGTFGNDGYMKLGIGDVFRKVAEMGGYTNASTGMAETNYTISIPQYEKEDLETAIAMQAAMMNNLEMSDVMVEKEHGPVCQEINMYSDDMPIKANSVAIKNLYNINSTSENLVAGRVDNIQNIDRKKVMDYYKNNYSPTNMTTVITGDVNPDDAINLIAKHFRGENKSNPDRRFEKLTPIKKTVRRDMVSDKAIATSTTIAFNGPASNDVKGQLALEVAFNCLFEKANSRISKPLKDLNADIVPEIEKISTNQSDGQVVSLNIETTEINNEKVLNKVFTELNNFKIRDNQELELLKQSIKAKKQDLYESPESINRMIGSNSFNYPLSTLTQQDSIIDSLTIADVENAVKSFMNTQNASIAVVHPKSTTAESLKINYDDASHNQISFRGNINQKESLPLDTSKITTYKLNNNYNVAFYDTPTNSNAKVEISYYPNKIISSKPGVPILLNRMLKDKTSAKDAPEFGNYLDNNNIKQELLVMSDGKIKISGQMPSENIQQFFNITQEQLMVPCFDEPTFNKQKAILKDILQHSKPETFEEFAKIMYPDSGLGYTSKDILNSIDNITIDDVKDYYNQIMQNSHASVAVAAPMADRTVLNSTLSSFSKMPTVKEGYPKKLDIHRPIQKSKVVAVEAPNSQAEILLGYNFKTSGNAKDEATFMLMNRILSNGDTTGLFNNLREKEKLAYSVFSAYSSAEDNSNISCNILTTTDNNDTGEHPYDNLQKSINGFNRQIDKMKKGEFTDKELEVAKKEFKNILKQRGYSQENCVETLSSGLNSPYGVNKINECYKAIETITRDDIQKAANYAFAGKPVYSIIASKNTIDANKEFLSSLEKS